MKNIVSKISMIIIKYLSLYILFFVKILLTKIEKNNTYEKYTSVEDEKIILKEKIMN